MRATLAFAFLLTCVLPLAAGSDWRHFRGTENTGVSADKNLPTKFDPGNVAWKAALPGTGPSCPIVVAGRVIVTAATGPRQDRLHTLAFDGASGKLLWERQLWATGHTICNPFGGVAGPTPASDGRRVFALFSSNDLACFDLDGNLQWFRGLAYESPTTRNEVGMASSPLVVGDTLIVQLENVGESFAMGLDTATGETRWRIGREQTANWVSPTLLKGSSPSGDLVLLQSRSCLTAHEPRTGKELWRHKADCSTMSSATTAGDRIYLPAGGGMKALRYDPGKQAISELWEERRLPIMNVSPVVHEGRLYTIKSPAILVCADAETGKVLWQLRLKGTSWATPVIADGHLYAVNYDGLIQVVRLGREGTIVGTGQIDGHVLATPAIADGAIYLRSNSHLWKMTHGGND